MKLARTGVIAAAVLSIATMAFAQAKPDFSGSWAPDPASAPAAGAGGGGGMRGGGGGPMVIKQDATTLTITRTMGENQVVQTYKLDGTESENKVMGRGGEMVTKSTAKWDGAKLVITTQRPGQDGAMMSQSQTYSLEGGNLVIESAGRDGAMQKRVYKKTT